MSTALKLNVPAQGQKITIANGKLVVPDQPIVPFIEGDGTGPDIWRASVRVMDAAVQKAYGGKRKIHWMEVYAGQKSNDLYNTWLPDETVAGVPRLPGVDQRSAHHADRRRHPLAERRAAPDARPVRLPAPGALVQGRALARQGAGEGRHGDLPRKHRGHLRRHRVRGGQRRQQEVPRAVPAGVPEAVRQDPLPEHFGHRHQARVAGRHGATVPRRHRVRDRQQAQERDDRAQGQHHEVHGRRVP